MVNCFINQFTAELQFYVSSFLSEVLSVPSDSGVFAFIFAFIIKDAATIKRSVNFMFPNMVTKIPAPLALRAELRLSIQYSTSD